MYTGSTDLSDVRNVNENKYVNRKFKKGGISVPRAPVLSMGNIDYPKYDDPYKHFLIICFINYRYILHLRYMTDIYILFTLLLYNYVPLLNH